MPIRMGICAVTQLRVVSGVFNSVGSCDNVKLLGTVQNLNLRIFRNRQFKSGNL
jgi:hypothetical protein